MHMEREQQTEDMQRRVKELQLQVDELKELVNTLLSVIVEEPDGVHSGAAPTAIRGVGRYSGLWHDAPSTKRLYPFVRWADHCHRGLGV